MVEHNEQVLITGGAGFIGGHLSRALLAEGKRVTVIDDLSTGLHRNVADLEGDPNFRLYVDTVRNEPLMDQLMHESQTVYHLASAVGVKLIMERPVFAIENIYQTTEVVLRLARRYRNRVILTSTSEVYGKSSEIPFREDGDRLQGATTKHRWAYATAKALDEFLALAHWKETQLPIVIVRLFNTVGPRQRSQYGMVLPNFVKRALHGDPLVVHGDGSQTRSFCHVHDVIGALEGLAAHAESAGQIYNVGSTDEISIRSLAERVIDVLDSPSTITYKPYKEIYGEDFEDMQRRVPAIDKIHTAIGWQPQRDLDTIIRDIADDVRQQII